MKIFNVIIKELTRPSKWDVLLPKLWNRITVIIIAACIVYILVHIIGAIG